MGPRIDILGDSTSAQKAFKDASQAAEDFSRSTDKASKGSDHVSAGFGRARIAGIRLRAVSSFGGMAAGLVVGAQAARATSEALRVTGAEAGTTEGKIRNLGASLLTGDVIGGLEALATKSYLTTRALADLQTQVDQGDFSHFQQEMDSVNVGVNRSLRDLVTGKRTLIDYVFGTGTENTTKLNQLMKLVDAAKLSINRDIGAVPPGTPFSATPGIAGGTPGLGPIGSVYARGAIAQQAMDEATKAGMSQRLQTAISGADATGSVRNQVAQRRRALVTLKKQLGQERLTDADRETINRSIVGLNSEIKSLTEKKKDDVVKTLVVISDALKSQEVDARMSGSAGRLKAVLQQEARELRRHLGQKLKPEDRVQLKEALLSVTDEVKSINKAAADALQQTADDLKSAAMDKLSLLGSSRTAKREIEDATAAMKLARQLGGPEGIKLARRDLEDARLDKQRALLESATVTGGKGGTTLHIGTLNLPGIQNAKQLLNELQRLAGNNAPQTRGRMPGHHLGLT